VNKAVFGITAVVVIAIVIAVSIPQQLPEQNSCDSSYPDVCIPVYPPDLDCGEIQFANFKVLSPDPHGFDADNDGIGCESGSTQPSTPVQPSQPKEISCDPSYPDVCIPTYPPDLDCGEILYANFEVLQPDPHGFDRDNDGIGCESGSTQSSTPVQPTQQKVPAPGFEDVPEMIVCDSSYPDVCIPAYPPDLDCGEIQFANFKVLSPDPHGFDGDNDGIGCES